MRNVACAPPSVWTSSCRTQAFDQKLLAYGFADFLLYVIAVSILVAADRGLFGLWAVIAPLGFLLTCIPIGPVSAAYWAGPRKEPARVAATCIGEAEEQWIGARMMLKALESETLRLESDLQAAHAIHGSLIPNLYEELENAKSLRSRIGFEIMRVDGQLAFIQDARRLSIVCGRQ